MTFEELLEVAPALAEYTKNMPEAIKQNFTLRTYPPHSIIHQKDSVLQSFGIVCRGEHRIINEFENGNIFMVEKNQAISFVGEVTLLAGHTTTSVTIETLTECLVMFISLADFELWVGQDNHFLRLLSQTVARKLYRNSYSSGERQFHSTQYVLMKYLMQAAIRQGLGKKERVVLRHTRQAIAEEMGMTVKTLNRTIARLKEEDLIDTEKGKVTLTKTQAAKARDTLGVAKLPL